MLIHLATGLGKTRCFTQFKRFGRVLILSHRDELVHQPKKYYNDCTFGVEKAEITSDGEEVVSASVQSLAKDNRLARFAPDDFAMIIVDEAHHAAAASYRKILDYFSGAAMIVGVTATPVRGDKICLSQVFDEIIYSKDLKWGIENKYLSRIRTLFVRANYSLDNIKKQAGDFNQGMLSDVMDINVMATAAKTYVEQCHNKGRHTLIYCVTIKNCLVLEEVVKQLLPEEEKNRVCVLSGKTPKEERAQMLKDFSDGKILCIINCMVLTEGTDLPLVDTIINLRPTCQASLYQQMVGRGTRLHPDKEDCLIIDVVPEEGRNRALYTAPALFGVDSDSLTETQKKILEGKTKTEEKESEKDGVDLIDFCENILHPFAKKCADIASTLSVLVMSQENFLKEIDQIFSENKKGGYPSVAEAYLEHTEKILEDYEELFEGEDGFGDLIVKKGYSPEQKFVIAPNFAEEIHISEPDILGKVTMELVSAKEKKSIFCKDLPFKEAFQLATAYCQKQEDSFKCSSFKTFRNNMWKDQKASQLPRR